VHWPAPKRGRVLNEHTSSSRTVAVLEGPWIIMKIPAIPPEQIECYSSAITLSDMEIFVFPELLYSLVLANLMSPKIWTWKQDPWFAKMEKLTPYRRVLRLKQYIIDHYEFNLDLDTWGLTTKEREIERFRPWMPEDVLRQSNALFGYEGDKHYFSLDIRQHFGLDKYDSNIIPYWKTETVEAMDAFRFKPGYRIGAGECVSLSTLYAAAMFILCGIPLEDIFLIATPLHSQNFIDAADGILTNNRRLVTKNMWFNGTELTEKAQRALRHEEVTIVSHATGFVHMVYPQATIHAKDYDRFRRKLHSFLSTEIQMETLSNFLRQNRLLQECFQIGHTLHGKVLYIPAEKVYQYEHSSTYKVSDATRERLLAEIDEDEFFSAPLPGRLLLNRFDDFFREKSIDLSREEDVARLVAEFDCQCTRSRDIISSLVRFARLQPRLPDLESKSFQPTHPIPLRLGMSREEIIQTLESSRQKSKTIDLAFYSFRDMSRTHWEPFIQSAMERNPVSIAGTSGWEEEKLISHLENLPSESIYDQFRLAQPDEVWNYQRGDGWEKAFCLANIFHARHPQEQIHLRGSDHSVEIRLGSRIVTLSSHKSLHKEWTFPPGVAS
jgi:hypothetical protein